MLGSHLVPLPRSAIVKSLLIKTLLTHRKTEQFPMFRVRALMAIGVLIVEDEFLLGMELSSLWGITGSPCMKQAMRMRR